MRSSRFARFARFAHAAPLAALAALAGCSTPGSLEVPRCPNPVLLGPVDRIGGHRAEPATFVRRVEGAVRDGLPRPTADEDAMAEVLGRRASDDAKALTEKVLYATEGRGDRDVRVDGIEAGAHVIFLIPIVAVSRWTRLNAKVVEVRK